MKPQTFTSPYTAQALFEALETQNEKAISHVYQLLVPYIKQLCRCYPSLNDEVGIISNDVILLLLKKIKEGKYDFQGVSPMAYAFKIAQFKVKNAASKGKNWQYVDLDLADYEMSTFSYQSDWENRDVVANMLRQLPSTGRSILLLQMKGYSDKEIKEMGYTNFANENVIKVMRSRSKEKLEKLKKYWN